MMTPSVVFWGVAAVLLFWTVGAYNRLMRLRADANTAFAAVDAELGRQIELVREQLPQDAPVPPPPGDAPVWAALQAAAAQLAASLASARYKPLDPERLAALATAHGALATAWENAQQQQAQDPATARLADAVLSRRVQLVLQAHAATVQFNQAVARYNEAIGQFPALLLALLFGFKPARPLPQVMVASLN